MPEEAEVDSDVREFELMVGEMSVSCRDLQMYLVIQLMADRIPYQLSYVVVLRVSENARLVPSYQANSFYLVRYSTDLTKVGKHGLRLGYNVNI
jgi:hypothetical protein